MTASNVLSQLGSPGVSTGFKNRIINGAMVIDQRNAGASVATSSGTYAFCVDRWAGFYSTTNKYTLQQNAGSVTPPVGFTNYLGVTSSAATSLSATDYYLLNQRIEGYNVADLGWGTANAKTVTLSFWVRSSLTGTFGGTVASIGDNRAYIFSYSIPSANTWTQISITVPGDTTGTWNTTNSTGISIYFSLGTGSTYSGVSGTWNNGYYYAPTGATSVVGTNGATFYVTGVQLEVGTTATNFDFRSYGTELALCQRYYFNWTPSSNFPVTTWYEVAGSYHYQTLNWPVTMRTTPTSSITGTVFYTSNASAVGLTARNSIGGDLIYATTSTGTAAAYPDSGNKISLSAEL